MRREYPSCVLRFAVSDRRAVQKKLTYAIKYPLPDASGLARLSPRRFVLELGWMRSMVSRTDANSAFKKAFSRPPRLLFGNPVAFIFSLYYAYIYAVLYLFIVSLNLLFGQPPFSTPGLFSYGWPQETVGLCYLGMTVGFGLSALTAATMQDRIYRRLSKKNGGVGQPEYRVRPGEASTLTPARPHRHRHVYHALRPVHLRLDSWPHALDGPADGPGRDQLRADAGLQLYPGELLPGRSDSRIL